MQEGLTLLHSDSLCGQLPFGVDTDDGRLVALGQRLTDNQTAGDLTNVLPGLDAVILNRKLFLRAGGKLTT
jgi:hypothetical protein